MSITSGRLPEWLGEKCLQKILESKLNRNCRVLSVDFGKGSNAGDHYLSEIVKVSVNIREDGCDEIFPLIVKDESQGWSDFVEEVNAIQKEIEVYTELIPFANRVLPQPVAADCYFISQSDCILLEDLTSIGYRLADRVQQLDYDHSKAALKSLAQFHATSVKLLEISPNSLKAASEETGFVESTDTIIYNLHNHVANTVLRTLKTNENGQEFVKELTSFMNTFWKDGRDSITGDFDFKVLNHGDFWITNILFKYDDDKVVHSRLVDFQLTRYGPPCFDLHLFIATSIRSDVRDRYTDELLDVYTSTLNTTLKEIGSSRTLSRQDLERDMAATKVIGILFGLSLAPVVLLDPSVPLQLDGATRQEICTGFKNFDPYRDIANNINYLKHIISLLKYYRNKCYI